MSGGEVGGANDGLVTKVSRVINGQQFRVINKTQTQHRLLESGGGGAVLFRLFLALHLHPIHRMDFGGRAGKRRRGLD